MCHERCQDKANLNEKANFGVVNEHFERKFNAVLTSAVIIQNSQVVMSNLKELAMQSDVLRHNHSQNAFYQFLQWAIFQI